MTDVYNIKDMEIRFEYDSYSPMTRWICTVYLHKIRKVYRFIDEANQYRVMCVYMDMTYPQEQIYKSILERIMRSGQMEKSEMAMYEEYFGTDDYSLTERLKKQKQNQFEAKREAFEAHKKEQSRITRSKLGITFWGALIVEDIL
ncbi:hypothetical protein XbC2_186 [Xanthomonas phage XbC2]|nr:hypothetical protein XbC2_186 [Xanthomonas phage XbC2]